MRRHTIFLNICIISFYLLGCKKSDSVIENKNSIPVVSTFDPSAIKNVSDSSADINATIDNDGGSIIIAKGVCWSTHTNPTISDNKTNNRQSKNVSANHTSNGTGSTAFIANLTGLNPYTTYYARIYATNTNGTGYSNQVAFYNTTWK
jgi:hypothetical protein